MSGKLLARASAISLAFMLAACGGDDSSAPLANTGGGNTGSTDSPDSNSGTDSDGDSSSVTALGSLNISARPVQMGTSESASSEIRIFARDTNNIVAAGVPVTISVNNDAALAIAPEVRDENGRALTDETGTAKATLSNAQNPRNRSVTITAQSGTLESSLVIAISGTNLSLEGPSSLSLNASNSYTVNLTDSEGNGIPLEAISVSGSLQNPGTVNTDMTGTAEISITPNAVGTQNLTVSAFDGEGIISASKTIEVSDNNFELNIPSAETGLKINQAEALELDWNINGTPQKNLAINFSATRGVLSANTATTGVDGKASVTITSSTSGTSRITATAPATGVSTSQTVEFVATQPSDLVAQVSKTQLNFDEQSRVTAIVRDAQNNLVKNQRILFNIVEGVSQGVLSVSEGLTDSLGRAATTFTAGPSGSGRDGVKIQLTLAEDTTINASAYLTVSEGAGRITMGTGNTLEAVDEDHYSKPWVIYVTDVNGQPMESVDVELSAIPVSYSTGVYVQADCDGNGDPDCWIPNITNTFLAEDGITGIPPNDRLDAGEDQNNSCALEPSKDATVVKIDNATTSNGAAHFALEYPKSNCNWTTVRIEARARVSGTEFKESVEYTLSCLASDLTDLQIPPPSINGGSKYNSLPSCP